MSRSFTDLGQSHSDLIFSNFFSSITAKPIEAKFHVEPPWHRRTNVCSNGLGHITRWPPCPYMVKKKQKFDDLETWYTAFGTQELPSLLK